MSDVSAVQRYFPTVNEGFTTTINGSIAANASTVALNSVAGLTDASVFVGIIEPGDATKQQVFTGTVDVANSRLINCVYTRGTSPTGHANGVTVVDYVTGTAINMISTGMRKQHLDNGNHGIVTATSLSATNGLAITGGSVALPTASVLPAAQKFSGVSIFPTSPYGVGNSVATSLGFASEEWDTDGYHNTSTNTERMVAPLNGYYEANAYIEFASWTGSNRFICKLQVVNATDTALLGEYDLFDGNLASDAEPAVTVALKVKLAAGQFVRFQVQQATGSVRSITTNSRLQLTWLGA